MTAPSPFQIAQTIGNKLGQIPVNQADRVAIDEIMEKASKTKNPSDMQMIIADVVKRVSPDRRQAILGAVTQKAQELQAQQQKEKRAKEYQDMGFPPELASFPDSVQAAYIKEKTKMQGGLDIFNQILGGGPGQSSQGMMQGGPEFLVDENLSVEELPQPNQNQSFNQTMDQPTKKGIESLDDSTLVAMTSIPGFAEPAKQELKRRQEESKTGQKKFEAERNYQSQRSLPYLKKLDESRDALDEKDQALFMMKDAILNGNNEFFSKDNFANFLGRFGEGLRTAKGAQLITAQKEFLLGNIRRAGSRPNQWIEQQVSNMLPKIGRSNEANLTVVAGFEASQEAERKKQEIADELVAKYEKELGYVPGNIATQVDKAFAPYKDAINSKLAYKLRDIHESEMGDQKIKANLGKKVPYGTPLTLTTARFLSEKYGSNKEAMKKAKELGYIVPSLEEYKRYIE